MKKIISYIVLVVGCLFIGSVSVKAVSLTSSATSVNVGKTITLSVSVGNGGPYSLAFDDGYFDVGNNSCGNRSSISSNCEIKLTARSSLSLTENKVVNITLTPTSNEDVQTVKITINANKKAPETPKESTTTQSPTTVAKSSDNTLKSLTITTTQGENVVLSPTFSKDVYIYEASVEGTVKTVTINAIPNDSKANVVLSSNADEELVSGEINKIVITVTAENGDKKAYTVNVEREALTGDATLKSLTIKESKKFKLTDDKFAYTVKVAKKVKKLTLEYETNDEKANVEVKGNKDLKDGSKVKVIVTAEDGTKKQYTLTISKQEEKKVDETKIDAERNPLIIMGLSIVAFGLIGAIVYVIKK